MKLSTKLMAILALVFGFSATGLAHEGHGDAPGTLKSNHGGIVKSGKEINLEYVVSGTELTLYPVSHEGQDLNPADVKIQATAKAPKGKALPLKLEANGGAFKAQIDFKGAYRSEVVVTTDVKGKKDTFKFQVEK